MTAVALLATLFPIATGALLVPPLPLGKGGSVETIVARACAATGIGLALHSCAYALALFAFDGAFVSVLGLDLGLFLLAVGIRRRHAKGPAAAAVLSPERSLLVLGLGVVFLVVLLASVGDFVSIVRRQPHGAWDAWAIWNTKARFLARPGPGWRTVLSMEAASPDYPLLVPGAVARAWAYAGAQPPLVAIVVAALFALATIGLGAAGLSLLRGRPQGLIAGLLLAPLILPEATSLYADVPLAFYLLATAVLLAVHDRFDPAGTSLPLLAGVAAGMGAWTKNEGLLFFLAALVVRTVATLRSRTAEQRRCLAHFALGAVPGLALVVLLKLRLPESVDVVSFLRWDAVSSQLLDPTRYWRVLAALAGAAKGMSHMVLVLPVWAVLIGLAADEPARRSARTPLSILFLVAGGFFGVYVVTPQDLAWHISTTFNRLLLQIYPLAVFATLLATASPEERMWAGGRPRSPSAPRRAPLPRAARRRASR